MLVSQFDQELSEMTQTVTKAVFPKGNKVNPVVNCGVLPWRYESVYYHFYASPRQNQHRY